MRLNAALKLSPTTPAMHVDLLGSLLQQGKQSEATTHYHQTRIFWGDDPGSIERLRAALEASAMTSLLAMEEQMSGNKID